MGNLKKYRSLLCKVTSVTLLWILSISFTACNSQITSQQSLQSKTTQNIDSILDSFQLKSGDIVFRKGRSIESQAILMADVEGNYSHVGIVYMQNNSAYIIHITPDSLEQTIDYAKLESLEEFFNPELACIGCVLRVDQKYSNQAYMAADSAYIFFKNKVRFDNKYDLATSNKMYCTELVLKAFEVNELNLININQNARSIPFFENKIIFPSAIFKCPYLENIYYF
ncbi:MAG: hypothetical protein KAG64_03475 [Bacteroidales bacterium]|nr:hypothetical protein [Bacteroidales bacterium]